MSSADEYDQSGHGQEYRKPVIQRRRFKRRKKTSAQFTAGDASDGDDDVGYEEGAPSSSSRGGGFSGMRDENDYTIKPIQPQRSFPRLFPPPRKDRSAEEEEDDMEVAKDVPVRKTRQVQVEEEEVSDEDYVHCDEEDKSDGGSGSGSMTPNDSDDENNEDPTGEDEEDDDDVVNITGEKRYDAVEDATTKVPKKIRDVYTDSEPIETGDIVLRTSCNMIMERAIEQLHPHKIPHNHETICVFCMNMIIRTANAPMPGEDEVETDDLKLLTLEYYDKLSTSNPLALSRMITRKYEKDIRKAKNDSYDKEMEGTDDPGERAALEAKKLPEQLELVTYLHFATTMHQTNAVTATMTEYMTLDFIKQILLEGLFVKETVDALEIEGATVDTSQCVPKVSIDPDKHRMFIATHDRSQNVMMRASQNTLFNAPRQVEKAARKSVGKPVQYTGKNSDKPQKAGGAAAGPAAKAGGGSGKSSYTSSITTKMFQPKG